MRKCRSRDRNEQDAATDPKELTASGAVLTCAVTRATGGFLKKFFYLLPLAGVAQWIDCWPAN